MSEGQKKHQVIGVCPECHKPVLESEQHVAFHATRWMVRHAACNIDVCPECGKDVKPDEQKVFCLGGGDPKANPPIKPRQQVKHLNCTGGSRYVAFALGED